MQIAITIYGNKIFLRIKICLTSACRTARFLQVNVKSSKRDCFVGDLRQTKTKTYFAKKWILCDCSTQKLENILQENRFTIYGCFYGCFIYGSKTELEMNSNHRLQRQQCYLCDCPRAPWAILTDFSEPICRGCCNYEGPDRIEAVIDYVRSLRKGWEHQVRSIKQQNLNSTGTSIGSSPSPGGHSNGSLDAASTMPNTPYPFNQYHNLIPHHSSEHIRFMHNAVKPEQPHPDGPPENFPPKNSFAVPNDPSQQSVVVNPRVAEEAAHEDHRRFMAGISAGKDGPHSRMPIIRRPPDAEYPEIVRETLEILNSCVPFDVRFKKDHNHVGRVFLFEAAPRTGATSPNEYELKIHIEYPRGSENFCQSASSVAKQMYQDAMKEFGRGLSSGFKYLEYEVQGSPNEWRLLGDLLPEPIRIFKEPLSRTLLPQRLSDHPNYHQILGPPGFGPNRYRAKRKADDIEPPGIPSRAPRRTYKEREDEQIQRHLWMQSQVDALRLSMAHLTGPPEASLHLNSIRANSMLDHPRHPAPLPHAPLTPGNPPVTPHQPSPKPPWGVPSSMAALISAASAETNSNSHSTKEPKASMNENLKTKSPSVSEKEPNADTKEDGSSHIKTEEKEPTESQAKKAGSKGTSQLKCSICEDWLEDTHFVQCPSVSTHKFCFPCSKESIRKQGFENDVFCPSGKRCPLNGSNLPWAFMKNEIQTILATKGRSKQSNEEPVKEEEKT